MNGTQPDTETQRLIRDLTGLAPDGSLHSVAGAQLRNGIYTLQNLQTGDHRTFRIKRQGPEARFAAGKRILSILTGPDNRSDYTSVAFVDADGIHVWKRHRDTEFEALARFLWSIVVDGAHADKYEVLHEGRCHICNRRLTEPESIRTGIGPVCGERLLAKRGIDPKVLKAYRLKAKLEGGF